MASTPNFAGTLLPFVSLIQNSDGTNKVAVCSTSSAPKKISALSLSSTDTADRTLAFILTVSSVDYLITTITAPASSGNANATPPVNLLAHANWTFFEYDANGNKVFVIPASATLYAQSAVAVASAKAISFVGVAQEY